MFAKAGAILPMGPIMGWGGTGNPRELTVHFYPGAANQFELYEDDGESQSYLDGNYAVTPISQAWKEDCQAISIGPVSGNVSFVPGPRRFTLIFHAICDPQRVRIHMNGKPIRAKKQYDVEKWILTISGLSLVPTDTLTIVLTNKETTLAIRQEGKYELLKEMLRAFRLGSDAKASIESRLQNLIEEPAQLGAYLVTMTHTQMRAFLEVITGAGVDFIRNTGEDLLILWNNEDRKDVTFICSAEFNMVHHPPDRYSLERGSAPRFEVVRPAIDYPPFRGRGGSPVVWQLDYAGLLKIITTYHMDTTYPRPQAGMY